MAAAPLNQLVRTLRAVVGARPADWTTDADLLDRYARDRDEGAFETLLQRHGAMVLGVCRRVLRNSADADDAFQATFLVLARKAGSLRSPQTLGNWLHGVGLRVASQARRAAARRRAMEARAMPRTETPTPYDGLAEVLDEELARLPGKYRSAVVLCDLEGKTRREAARELGWAEGTVASRLARGRALLGRRLLRRGLGPVGTSPSPQDLPGCLPAPLAAVTIQAGMSLAAGQSIRAVAPAAVALLVEGTMKAMQLAKIKALVGVSLVLMVAACTCGMLAGRQTGGEGAPKPPPTATAKKGEDAAKKDLAALQGTWIAVRIERSGKEAPAEMLKDFKVVIKGDKMTIWPGRDDRISTIKLNPSKSPKWMDNTPHEGPAKGKSLPAIYELKGDTLKMCFDNEGVSDERPREFKSTPGSGLCLFVLKKEKKEEKKAKATAKDAAVKDDLKRLEGTWRCIALELGGKRIEGTAYSDTYGPNPIVFKGNKLIVSGKAKITCTFTIDPTRTPKWIDSTRDSDGLKLYGIYELKDGKLKLYEDGGKRPTEFKTRKGTDDVFHIYEKVEE
jgi:RNA polymerase sigma factor (sigma-70 family)